jgi:WXG100 family type VII secretion target
MNNMRVSDVQDLRTEANLFQDHAEEIRNITNAMLEVVNGTQSVWRGEARTRYSTQFEGLSDDMQRLYQICSDYCTDLQEIATNYENAENDNIATAAATKSDIVMA